MPSFVEGLKAGLGDWDGCKVGCPLVLTALIGAQVIAEPERATMTFLGVLHGCCFILKIKLMLLCCDAN